MADLELNLHPLVPKVAAGLFALKGVIDPPKGAQERAKKVADEIKSATTPSRSAGGREQPPEPPDEGGYAQALADSSGLPALVTFAGYLGATVQKDDKVGPSTESPYRGLWTLLYLDTRLRNWLLVQTDGIVFRAEARDEQAPFKQRDVLWVTADTPVGRGDGSVTVEAQFLTGAFTQAGDFDDRPPDGGTLSAATGVFCEARSVVGCCLRKSRG